MKKIRDLVSCLDPCFARDILDAAEAADACPVPGSPDGMLAIRVEQLYYLDENVGASSLGDAPY